MSASHQQVMSLKMVQDFVLVGFTPTSPDKWSASIIQLCQAIDATFLLSETREKDPNAPDFTPMSNNGNSMNNNVQAGQTQGQQRPQRRHSFSSSSSSSSLGDALRNSNQGTQNQVQAQQGASPQSVKIEPGLSAPVNITSDGNMSISAVTSSANDGTSQNAMVA